MCMDTDALRWLQQVADASGSGRYFNIFWGADGRIGAIQDSAGRQVQYPYLADLTARDGVRPPVDDRGRQPPLPGPVATQGLPRSSGGEVERKTDSFGFEWVIVHDKDIEDQVTAVHAIASELTNQGFGAQLLAAPVRFEGGEHPVYWIYGFKRGKWWPFIPTGEGQNRDNATELELKAKLEPELPIEPDLTRWLGLFDAPI